MRFAVAAVALVLATTQVALAQPGATEPTNYGPAPAPPTYAPAPAPTYAPAPQPTYYPPPADPRAQPTYAPAPQPYYPPQPNYQYQPRPYAPLYGAPAASVTQPAPRPIKSESSATWLSIGATAAGIGGLYLAARDENGNLAIASVALTLIGPSVGHIYAGETGHAVKMSLLRAAGLLTLGYGAYQADTYSNSGCIDYCSNGQSDGKTTMLVGGAILLGATLYDFYDAGRAARRTNEKAARALTVAPTMMSTYQGASPGVAISGAF
jgi:hypothetical protein